MSQTEAGTAAENPSESFLQPGETRGQAMGTAKHLLYREASFQTLRGEGTGSKTFGIKINFKAAS